MRHLLWLCLALLPCSAQDAPNPSPEEAIEGHRTLEVEGWQVHFENELFAPGQSLGPDALALLRAHLHLIAHAVPAGPLAKLREVVLWVGVKDSRGKHACACYHPSRRWLEDNDYDPRKARCVDIANAANYLRWTRAQPWMVFHELAHAYHHQVLGWDHEGISAAFEAAREAGNYAEVLHINGSPRKHYALTNAKEYFAEASEAYFGTNDFYPFVRAELKTHDPELWALLEEVWR